MPPVRVLRACEKSASPAVQVPAEGAVFFSHQLPVCPVSVSVAPVREKLPAARPWVVNSAVAIRVVHVLSRYAA